MTFSPVRCVICCVTVYAPVVARGSVSGLRFLINVSLNDSHSKLPQKLHIIKLLYRSPSLHFLRHDSELHNSPFCDFLCMLQTGVIIKQQEKYNVFFWGLSGENLPSERFWGCVIANYSWPRLWLDYEWLLPKEVQIEKQYYWQTNAFPLNYDKLYKNGSVSNLKHLYLYPI